MYQPTKNTSAQALRPRWQIIAAAWAVLGLAACQSAATTGTAEVPTEASLQQQINKAIGDAPCTADSQCRTIGVGAKACGGPAAWRPWSTQNGPKAETLQSLADQLATLQRHRQAQSGMVSTCSYLPDPGAVCQAQRCVLKKTADPAS